MITTRSKVCIVALEMLNESYGKYNFEILPVSEKIDFFIKKIETIYLEKINKYKDLDGVIFVCRENWINMPEVISNEEKNKLKDETIKLCKNYDGLIVFAGSILFYKTFTEDVTKYLKKADEIYKKHTPHLEEEPTLTVRMKNYHEDVEKLKGSNEKIPLTTTTRVKNDALCFFGDKYLVHGKIVPHKEFNFQKNPSNLFFSPGKDTESCILEIPLLNGKKIIIGINICQDLLGNFLIKTAKKRGITIDLEFLFSDTIYPIQKEMVAREGLVHVDSRLPSYFITRNKKNESINFEFIFTKTNFYDTTPNLREHNPIEFPMVYELINQVISGQDAAKNSLRFVPRDLIDLLKYLVKFPAEENDYSAFTNFIKNLKEKVVVQENTQMTKETQLLLGVYDELLETIKSYQNPIFKK